MSWALDSSYDRPTAAQAAAAKAAGIGWWFGYLATVRAPGSFNLVSPWGRASFQVLQAAGLRAGAFCSGWDDPTLLRQLAAEWGLVCLLDHEPGIRPDGPWVQPWLDASGFGLYATRSLQGYRAPYRIAAEYPAAGCTGGTWPVMPAPSEPHGWQCQGTHTEFGLSVDRSALDDWFGGTDMTDEEHGWLLDIHTGMGTLVSAGGPALAYAIKAEIDTLKAEIEAGGSVDAAAAIARIEGALKSA